jgi:hypothetical protein
MFQPRDGDFTSSDTDELDNYLLGTGRARYARSNGYSPALWPGNNAGPEYGSSPSNADLLVLVGNPANRRLRSEYERSTGQAWPRDPRTGRNYDVAHIRAIADGGKNELSNIRPMHPDAHLAEHIANGDLSRWAKRAGIAAAFGGKVERSLGAIGYIPNITGIISGRIRTDNFDNFANDMIGMPSRQDRMEAFMKPEVI